MKTMWKLLFAVTLVQAWFTLAFALQAAGVPPPAPPALPATDDQAVALAGSLWDFMVNKNWAMAVGPALTLIIWALRKWDVLIPKVGASIDKFLNQPAVAFLLPTVISAVGGFVTALVAHQPLGDATKAVFQASMSAVFTYVGLKKLGEQAAAGQAAASGVSDKATAVEAMKQAAKDEEDTKP